MIKKKFFSIGASLLLLSFVLLGGACSLKKPQAEIKEEKKINALMMLIEFERIEGILQWEKELDSRGLTALVEVRDEFLKLHPEVFKRLADKGYEIAGVYNQTPFWDMSYEEQYKHLKDAKDLVENITGKKMRVFGAQYFSYDETTLKAASDLGIEYVLGRGVSDVEANVYQPLEYSTKIISVSNVDVGEPMGRGSLCDYSLWARGAGADEFGQILDESIAKKPNDLILVSHSYLGGTRIEWWNEYERALNSSEIEWRGFSEWLEKQESISLPNAEIPRNTEVKYGKPIPEKAMEDYDPIPGLEEEKNHESSFSEELKCF
ncbi:MAG: polysaccharide deacetylase family protein [Candidatus Magasanikbacteria bacterium]|jgi:hypothetical protein|nr:polysaccharide deacetylase family protein [Candidatus Magasanikbacteria bacterium]